MDWNRAALSGVYGFTHGLLGQRVLEAAAQGLLGGWPGMRRLGVRQQVLGGGRALGIGPFDAVHLDRGLGWVVDSHVHHGGRGLHWGAGHGGFRAAPQHRVAGVGRGAPPGLAPARVLPTPSSARPPRPPGVCPLPGTFR